MMVGGVVTMATTSARALVQDVVPAKIIFGLFESVPELVPLQKVDGAWLSTRR